MQQTKHDLFFLQREISGIDGNRSVSDRDRFLLLSVTLAFVFWGNFRKYPRHSRHVESLVHSSHHTTVVFEPCFLRPCRWILRSTCVSCYSCNDFAHGSKRKLRLWSALPICYSLSVRCIFSVRCIAFHDCHHRFGQTPRRVSSSKISTACHRQTSYCRFSLFMVDEWPFHARLHVDSQPQ